MKQLDMLAVFVLILALFITAKAQDDVSILMAVTDVDNMVEGEIIVLEHFEAMGSVVDIRTSSELVTGDDEGYDLVFIHEAIGSGTIADKFKESETPMMTTEFYLSDDYAFSGTVTDTDFGSTSDDSDYPLEEYIFVMDSTHYITNVVPEGVVQVYDIPGTMGYARVGGEASILATPTYSEEITVLYVFEKGALDMNDEPVPERRAFFFTFAGEEVNMNETAWTLFDRTMQWCLHQDTDATGITDVLPAPSSYRLHQNMPNPFNPSTQIDFEIPSRSDVTLRVFNLLGENIATLVSGVQDAGHHSIIFNASDLPSGVYYYQLNYDGHMLTKKMALIK